MGNHKNGEWDSDEAVIVLEGRRESALKDRRGFVLWSVYFMGVVMLLPWNMLINVNYFWDYKFRNTSLDDAMSNSSSELLPPPTKLQKEFTSYLSIASNVPNAVFVILHALLGHLVGMRIRVLGSQIGQMIVFACITALALVDSDSWQKTFLAVNLSAIAFMNVFNAVFQGSVMANLANFPEKYIGHHSSGQGMGGLLPSVVNVIILAFPNSNSQFAGFYCFLFALVLSVVCLALSFALTTSPYYTRHSALDRRRESEAAAFDLMRDLPLYLGVLRGAWAYHAVVVVVFATTLAVFPAVTVLVEPSSAESTPWNDVYFVPVCCFVLFNFGDYFGKQLATAVKWPGPSRSGQALLLLVTALRVALVPLLMYCNVSPLDRQTEVLFLHEGYYVAFLGLLAVSNGYLTTISFMFGPKVVEGQRLSEMTAAFLVAFILIGCSLGSVLSTPLVRLL